jgi:pyridoxamine 5'-phosphate oxidase
VESLPAPDADPLASFLEWQASAQAGEPHEATACCLATADLDGAPSARMVLFRGLHRGQFCFYTNYESRKAQQLRENPRAALLFYWHSIGRQVRIEGSCTPLAPEVSDRYFATRPPGSQMSAWASPQSHTLGTRSELLQRVDAVRERFEHRPIPRPPFWGGFGLAPARIEFWISAEDRLHWRREFVRQGKRWQTQLLAP